MDSSFDPRGTQTGAVHWIDHYVCNSEDVPRWAAFNHAVLGAVDAPDPVPGIFQVLGCYRIGAFRARAPMPRTLGLGHGLPRHGYYVRQSDVDAHRRRLEAVGAVHGDPVRTSADGESGISLPFQDPDGNQFEFWAPDVLPDGAMAYPTALGVGRISHGVFESRDLERTADFFKRFCEIDRVRGNDIAADTLVLRLRGGARLVFKQVETLGRRTTGLGMADVHTALMIPAATYFANYRRLWANVPEWKYDAFRDPVPADAETLPARTMKHPSPEGLTFYGLVNQGDDFLDWDTNLFHFVGGIERNGSLADYDGYTVGAWAAAWEIAYGTFDGFREAVTAERAAEKVLV